MIRSAVRALGRHCLPASALWRYVMHYNASLLHLRSFVGRLRRLFHRPALPQVEGNAVYLHLGCGPIDHPKFINIDLTSARHIHYIRSVDNLSPFKDCSVDLIYASHCLEHFSFHVVQAVLQEWHRVLRFDGILRLSVPDFDVLLNIYHESNSDINSIISPLMGGQDYMYNYHKTIFNAASLEALLASAGFHSVNRWLPGSSELTTFDDWSARHIVVNGKEYPISLNIEAIK